MKHECVKGSGREREMDLMWTCSCGEQIPANEDTYTENKLFICYRYEEDSDEYWMGAVIVSAKDEDEALEIANKYESYYKVVRVEEASILDSGVVYDAMVR